MGRTEVSRLASRLSNELRIFTCLSQGKRGESTLIKKVVLCPECFISFSSCIKTRSPICLPFLWRRCWSCPGLSPVRRALRLLHRGTSCCPGCYRCSNNEQGVG